MINKAAILLGALGGVGPNLVRLLVNYSSPSPQQITSQPFSYCMAMIGFAAVGGLVVWAFQETNLKQALLIGIGLPALFQIGTLQSLPSSTPPPNSAPPLAGTEASISLISSAYAQPPPGPSASVPGRKLNLTGDTNIPQYTVAFYRMNNSLRSSLPVKNPATVDVPEDAVKFALQLGESTSHSYALPKTAAAVMNAEVKIQERAISGFLQGVGLAKGRHFEIEVRIQ